MARQHPRRALSSRCPALGPTWGYEPVTRSISRIAILALILLAPALSVWAAGGGPLTIKTTDGRALNFTVEFAQTPPELELGLMNRPSAGG